MKKIATFFLAIGAFYTVNAQDEFDTAIQNQQVKNITTNNLFTTILTTASNTNEATIMPGKKGISLMPSAGSKNIKVLYNSTEAGSAIIEVLDKNGKKLLSQNTTLSIGKNNIVINNFFELNEGNYIIQLISKDTTYTSAFIVWK